MAFVDMSGRVWPTRAAYEEFCEERKEMTRQAWDEVMAKTAK